MFSEDLLPHQEATLISYEVAFTSIAHLLPESGWEYSITSHKIKTNQKKAKKKGYSVALVYMPKARITEGLHNTLSQDNINRQQFFIRITLYNETLGDEIFAKKLSHYIPIRLLAELFQLGNAIRCNKLFEFFEDPLMDMTCESAEQGVASLGREHRKQRFYTEEVQSFLYGNSIYLYDKDEHPKGHAQFSIKYCPRNEKGELTPFPWKLTCLETPYEPGDDNFHVWDKENLKETYINVSQEQLVETIERIHLAVYHLPESIRELYEKELDKNK